MNYLFIFAAAVSVFFWFPLGWFTPVGIGLSLGLIWLASEFALLVEITDDLIVVSQWGKRIEIRPSQVAKFKTGHSLREKSPTRVRLWLKSGKKLMVDGVRDYQLDDLLKSHDVPWSA